MSSANCKAITKSGEKCKLKANFSGYCHIHDPEKIAEYEAKQHLPEMFRRFRVRSLFHRILDMRSDYVRHAPRRQVRIREQYSSFLMSASE